CQQHSNWPQHTF
nr:immunoglobulin light chain junction region [Macaca mulatta]